MVSTIRRSNRRGAQRIRSSEVLDRSPISITEASTPCLPPRADARHQSEAPARAAAASSTKTTHVSDKSSTAGWIKLMRSDETHELARDAAALGLMTIIALRARWRAPFKAHDLDVGEALIGDHENMGLTRQEYRTLANRLKTWGLITTRSTNKGTIATITNRAIFDIFGRLDNHQGNQPATSQQPPSNQPVTTNEEGNKGKKEKTNHLSPDPRLAPVAAGFYQAYEKVVGKKYARIDDDGDGAALARLLSVLAPDEYPPEEIIRVARAALVRSKQDRFSKSRKLSASLRGFCHGYNEIQAELDQAGAANGHAGSAHPKGTQAEPTGEEVRAWLRAVILSRSQYQHKLSEWQCCDDLPPTARKEFLDWRRAENSSPRPACAPCPDSPETNLPSSADHKNP